MAGIFSEIKVLDISKVFSGPLATRMLADYGADVLKIESEARPDDSRSYPPLKDKSSGYFEILNRNKKGISLDLINENDLQKFYKLCQTADVVVENLTPSSKYKLKIDYETVTKYNPTIIYASLSGTGQQSNRKYYDIIAQAESGLMSLSGTPVTPMKIGPSVVDAFSGMTLAFAIASALFYRQKTGKGQFLDVTMLGASFNLLEANLIDYSLSHRNPTRPGNQDNAISPFGVYSCKDGYIVMAAGSQLLWNKFCSFLQTHTSEVLEPYTSNESRIQNNHKLTAIIESVFSQFNKDELIKILSAADIPCSLLQEMSDVADNPSLFEQQMLQIIDHPVMGKCIVPGRCIHFSEDNSESILPAPQIGQDNSKYGI